MSCQNKEVPQAERDHERTLKSRLDLLQYISINRAHIVCIYGLWCMKTEQIIACAFTYLSITSDCF